MDGGGSYRLKLDFVLVPFGPQVQSLYHSATAGPMSNVSLFLDSYFVPKDVLENMEF